MFYRRKLPIGIPISQRRPSCLSLGVWLPPSRESGCYSRPQAQIDPRAEPSSSWTVKWTFRAGMAAGCPSSPCSRRCPLVWRERKALLSTPSLDDHALVERLHRATSQPDSWPNRRGLLAGCPSTIVCGMKRNCTVWFTMWSYVDYNPVSAGLAANPRAWPWPTAVRPTTPAPAPDRRLHPPAPRSPPRAAPGPPECPCARAVWVKSRGASSSPGRASSCAHRPARSHAPPS